MGNNLLIRKETPSTKHRVFFVITYFSENACTRKQLLQFSPNITYFSHSGFIGDLSIFCFSFLETNSDFEKKLESCLHSKYFSDSEDNIKTYYYPTFLYEQSVSAFVFLLMNIIPKKSLFFWFKRTKNLFLKMF